MKKEDDRAKRKAMYLVTTFGAVFVIALAALVSGMINKRGEKSPRKIDLNATLTPQLTGTPGTGTGDGTLFGGVALGGGPDTRLADGSEIGDGIGNGDAQLADGGGAGVSGDEDTQLADGSEIGDGIGNGDALLADGSGAGVSGDEDTQLADGSGASDGAGMGDADTQLADGSGTDEDTEGQAVLSPEGILATLKFSRETGMLWPVTGEALIAFSPDHAIYHKTLDSFRTSDYVILGGAVGTHVSAAADGVVTAITNETRTGTTVTMLVSENYEIKYGMLSNVVVAEGEVVEEGMVFATVAEPTRYYLEEGSGVWLQVLEDGKPVNPMLFLR